MTDIKFRILAATDDGIEMLYLDKLEFDNGLWFTSLKHIDEHLSIMQYIGMKDMNGKDIYEGDIVKKINSWGDSYYEVTKNKAMCGFFPFLQSEVTDKDREMFMQFEIISNIHEATEEELKRVRKKTSVK